MELRRVRERPTISDPASSDSATTTAVNTPDSDQFPQDARSSHSQNTASEPFPGSSDDDSDAESAIPPEDSMEGWPQLAQLMAQTPDFAAFPRFRDLQVKSLLYYQCELSTLRKKLHELEFTDKAKRNKPYNENVDRMIRDRQTSDQFKTIEQIRIVLKKYSMLWRDGIGSGRLADSGQTRHSCSTHKYAHCPIRSHSTCALCANG